MRNVKLLLVFLALVLVINILPCHAGKGKNLFVQRCGQCHKQGGEAPTFAATKYAGAQWERFFERNKHKRKKDISSLISAEEQQKVKKYLVNHAVDSDQPEAVGLR